MILAIETVFGHLPALPFFSLISFCSVLLVKTEMKSVMLLLLLLLNFFPSDLLFEYLIDDVDGIMNVYSSD